MEGLVSGSAECLAPDHRRGWDIICSVWRGTGVSVLAGGRGRLWMDRVEDEVLVRRVASGDERALSGLYDRYAGLVYGTGMRYLGDRGTAEELVQDVFTSVWKNAAGFDPARASFATWVYRITRNRATDLIRRRKARVRTVDGRTALRTRRDGPFWRALAQLRRGRRALAAHAGSQGGARPRLLPRPLAARDLRPHRYAPGYCKEPHHGGAARPARDYEVRRGSVVRR